MRNRNFLEKYIQLCNTEMWRLTRRIEVNFKLLNLRSYIKKNWSMKLWNMEVNNNSIYHKNRHGHWQPWKENKTPKPVVNNRRIGSGDEEHSILHPADGKNRKLCKFRKTRSEKRYLGKLEAMKNNPLLKRIVKSSDKYICLTE